MICPAFSTLEVSGNDDVLAVLPLDDDIMDDALVL